MQSKSQTYLISHGVYWSGSSAVYDLLKEYRPIAHVPYEFDEFRLPGMVCDHLAGRIAEDYPFRLDDYIHSRQRQWLRDARRLLHPKQVLRLPVSGKLGALWRERRRNRQLSKLAREFKGDQPFEHRKQAARGYLRSVGKIYGPEARYLLLDQAILTTQHLAIWPELFEPFKMIITFRDPRDQFAQMIKQKHLFLNWNPQLVAAYGGDRDDAFRFLVDATRNKLNAVDRIRNRLSPERVLLICFEQFIQEHEKEKNRIEEFLELTTTEHLHPGRFLKPEVSVQNIGIHEEILSDEQVKMLGELMLQYDKLKKEISP